MIFGFIGCGNMGGAMLRQMLKAGIFAPEEVIISDKNPSLRAQLKSELGVNVTYQNAEAAAAPVLLLAVKPQFIQAVGQEIAGTVNLDALVISIVAGYDLNMLHALLNSETAHIIRVMPNTPALVGEGMTALCDESTFSKEDFEFVEGIFDSIGKTRILPERLFDGVVALSGSSPAYVYMMIEAMADAAVKEGIPRVHAYEMAAQSVLGSALMVLSTGTHPAALKDAVCSPGGTTIQGVRALEERGFRGAVIEAVIRTYEKNLKL